MKSLAPSNLVYDLPWVSDHPYIDLRSQPSRIDEIPELGQEPRLKPLVSILNDPCGLFMTHGCARASRPPGIPDRTPIRIPYGAKDARSWYSSYVIFSFWYIDDNQGKNYKTIYDSYPDDKNDYNVAFEVEAAYFCTPPELMTGLKSGGLTNGTLCGLWMSGWGSNPNEAQHRWAAGISDLVAFFTNPPFVITSAAGVTLAQHMFGRS